MLASRRRIDQAVDRTPEVVPDENEPAPGHGARDYALRLADGQKLLPSSGRLIRSCLRPGMSRRGPTTRMPTRSPGGVRAVAPKRRTVTRSASAPLAVSKRIPSSISDPRYSMSTTVPAMPAPSGGEFDLLRPHHDAGVALDVGRGHSDIAEAEWAVPSTTCADSTTASPMNCAVGDIDGGVE